MNYIRMGKSGLIMTEVTFGSALTIGTESKELCYAQMMIDKAWELGIRSFDISNNYGYGEGERLVGKSLSKYPRQEYIVATKGSWQVGNSPYHKGLSRKHILWAFEESMKNMGLEYVDIYYAHRYDPETPMEEIVRVFNYLINTGRVRYWATSEWPVDALKECHEVCDKLGIEKPVLEQSIYSFALRKAENNGVADFCNKNGIGLLGFSPLCQGLLTGKYRNGIPAGSRVAKSKILNYDKTMNYYYQNQKRIDTFLSACDKYHLKSVHIAILWSIRKHFYPVIGSSTPEQLEDNMGAFSVEVPDELWKELELI